MWWRGHSIHSTSFHICFTQIVFEGYFHEADQHIRWFFCLKMAAAAPLEQPSASNISTNCILTGTRHKLHKYNVIFKEFKNMDVYIIYIELLLRISTAILEVRAPAKLHSFVTKAFVIFPTISSVRSPKKHSYCCFLIIHNNNLYMHTK